MYQPSHLFDKSKIEGSRHRSRLRCLRQDEFARIENLGYEPPPDLYHIFIERSVCPQPRAGRPVPHGVSTVLIQKVHRCQRFAFALGHLLSIGVQDPSGDHYVRPGYGCLVQHRLGYRIKRPRSDYFVARGANVGRKQPGVLLGIQDPSGSDLRAHRAGKPGIEYVGLAGESARLIALGFVVPGWNRLHWIERQRLGWRKYRMVPVRIAMLVQSVPEGECHSKIPLSADAPIELQILGPVAISQPYKIRMPLNAIAHLDQPVFLIHQPYEPLARRYEFQRPLALLIEFYRVFDGFWRLDQRRSAVARRAFSHAQQFGNRLL